MNSYKKTRILYFCSRLPSNIQGGLDLRIRGQISALLNFADVGVFALNGSGGSFDPRVLFWKSSKDTNVSKQLDAAAGLAALKQGSHPFQVRFSKQTEGELQKEITQFKPTHVVLSRIDLLIYAQTVRGVFDGKIILDLDESVRSTGPSILEVISHPGQALVHKAFFKSMESLELTMFQEVDQVWVSSDPEKNNVPTLGVRQDAVDRTYLIPNNIRTEDYKPIAQSERKPNTIIYPASFAYEPTLDAARLLINEIMPRLPNVNLQFVGSHIPDWIREVQAENIQAIGPVPNMIPYLQQARAIVIPLRAGGGTRLKAVEALASGLPIVSTAFGVEGLDLIPGRDYLQASTPSDFVNHCTAIVANDSLFRTLSANGLNLAERKFSLLALERQLRHAISA